MAEKPIIFHAGKKVALGPMRKDLNETYQKWNNDLETTRTLAILRPVTLEEQQDAYDRFTQSEQMIFFTIYEKTGLIPMGFAYLGDIDYKNRTADFGIMIGEKDFRGKGYGTETTQVILDYAFTIAGLHSVMLRVYEFNQAGIHAYQKAGFMEFGRRRQSRYIGGRYWDEIYMECLESEFEGSTIKERLGFE